MAADRAPNVALAGYRERFQRRDTKWAEILQRNAARLAAGQYSLHWLDTDGARWGRRARPSSRGLTYTDVNQVPGYGDVPEIATHLDFTPRGAVRDRYLAEMPVVADYTVTDGGELWAENVITLYEEAKARQWNATRDIPWSELAKLPERGRALYGATLERFLATHAKMGERTATTPEAVAAVIQRALEARRPNTRYAVGADMHAIRALRWLLPDRAVDAVFARMFGL